MSEAGRSEEDREALLDVWELAAPGWGRQAERFSAAVEPVTAAMLAAAPLAPGRRVLELAAGPGDLSRRAAPLVAPTQVLCTDGVQAMLDVAAECAEADGITNIAFQRAQLEWIDLPAATADVILCRYGLMLAVDPEAALRELRRVLAPGGTVVLAVQAAAALNPWVTTPPRAATELGLLEATSDAAGPGPFALADAAALTELMGDCGFFDAVVHRVDFHYPYANALDWLGEKIDHSPRLAAVWRELDDARRGELRARLDALAEPYRQPDGSLEVPGSALVAAAEA
jgi:ubiquinone/menaquinone biosynthesis C-methylase UbiE